MTAIGRLINHPEHHLKLVAMNHSCAIEFLKRGDRTRAFLYFHIARLMIANARKIDRRSILNQVLNLVKS